MFSRPKLICLDTSTWGNLARDVSKDKNAERVMELIQGGSMIPYITWHHLAELMHHGNDFVVSSRIELIKSLKFVAFPCLPEEVANVGSVLDLQGNELSVLLANPKASYLEITNLVRSMVTNGFATGKEFCQKNEDWWHIYRNQFSQCIQSKQAEISALSHFPVMNEDEAMSNNRGKYKLCNSEQAARKFSILAKKLEDRLTNDVKKPLPNPREIAYELMNDAYQYGMTDYDDQKEGLDWLLKKYDVDRERLPSKPKLGDIGDEAVFIKQLSTHERRLNLPDGSLKHAVRKEMLPSWRISQLLGREIRRIPKAESGNLNDKMIATFGLYVDYIQLDKRIRNCINQLAKKSELFQILNRRLIKAGNYNGLISELEQINQS